MDRDADVVLLYKLLNSRQSFECRVTGDNNAKTSSLAVFEFGPYVRIFVFRKIDGSSSMKLDACRGVVRQRGCLLLCVHREMIFRVLRIQGEHIDLLHEADHL